MGTTTKTRKKKPVSITAYKAFGKDWKCRGFQYEVGKTYDHDGKVKACESGFHACENPLDVLSYYDLIDSKFAIVEMSGEIARHAGDSKVASARIEIKAEIGIPRLVSDAIKWVTAACKGDAATVSEGHYAKLAASGHYAKLAASGDSAKLAASGHYAKLAASGDSAQLAASGDYAQLAASGDSAQLAASGDSAQLDVTGKNGVAVFAAPHGSARASEGGCFAIRWNDDKRPRMAVGYVGEDGIKADTWYTCDRAGKLVEVKSC